MRGAKPTRWLGAGPRWIVASAVGYAAGIGLWQAAFPFIRPALAGQAGAVLSIAGFGALLGVCVGLAQSIALRSGRARLGARTIWTLASGAGFAVGLLLATWVGGAMALVLSGHVIVYVSDGSEDLTFGLLLGAFVGLARWLAVRRAQPVGAARWIWASAIALAIGWSATLGIFDVLPGFAQPWLGAAFGGCAGALVGLVEWASQRVAASERGHVGVVGGEEIGR